MGVEIEIIEEGDGKNFAKSLDVVTMHYKGTVRSEEKPYDCTYSRSKPFAFQLGSGQVIKGIDDSVPKLSLGSKAKLHISSDLAYGKAGAGGVIPPDSDLVLEVEILKIN
mmetsp:Transcript_81863/g.128932  ORF Transcript_81863/g.128932 Transcript_81863/m.128932 type:complete len:110 (-) Transcript_81863:36-365(-)